MTLPNSGLITVNDRGARAATTFGSVAAVGGNMVFIKKLTASSSGTLSFVDGSAGVVLDGTYKEYVFTFNNIHPASNAGRLSFQTSTDTGSNYGVTLTSTAFEAYHDEDDSPATLGYAPSLDIAQGTGFQSLTAGPGNDNDQCVAGTLRLFNPSSTTFVKHWISDVQEAYHADFSTRSMQAGYFNTTSAIDAVQFKMHSGNMDVGDICLYGIL